MIVRGALKLLAAILALFGAIGFLFIAIGAERVWQERQDIAVFIVVTLIVGGISLGLITAAHAIFRGARLPEATLSWMPSGSAWLDQRAWRELPDPLAKPARRKPLPMPAVGVPPDELLRKLWAVRAELAHSRRYEQGYLGASGLVAVIALFPLVIILIGIITGLIVGEAPRSILILVEVFGWLLIVAIGAIVRPTRRYRALVRLESELAAHDQARPGGPQSGNGLPFGVHFRKVTDALTGYTGYYHPTQQNLRHPRRG